MTMLQFVSKITDDSKKDMLLKVVSDKYYRIILYSVMDKSKSVTEVAVETGISVSTIYGKIQVLCDGKLLAISGTISKDGKNPFSTKVRCNQFRYSSMMVN